MYIARTISIKIGIYANYLIWVENVHKKWVKKNWNGYNNTPYKKVENKIIKYLKMTHWFDLDSDTYVLYVNCKHRNLRHNSSDIRRVIRRRNEMNWLHVCTLTVHVRTPICNVLNSFERPPNKTFYLFINGAFHSWLTFSKQNLPIYRILMTAVVHFASHSRNHEDIR